ncbi:hypothetical protein NFI96_003412 [Prochilodus magdalenae]|nr:hypothetical protein NFI96_003412 [Prochilodus magdalenae]
MFWPLGERQQGKDESSRSVERNKYIAAKWSSDRGSNEVLKSIDKVSKVASPVLVIHGTEDEVIDFSHGLAIYERCPRAVEPLWVEGAGHNDIELYAQYLERLKQFISFELATS